jgi:hypothetical protein
LESDHSAPGRKVPLTSLISDTLPIDSEPPHRSMASVRARRTRTSSNGFLSVLKVRRMLVTHGPSCTVTLSFMVSSSWSRSCGVRPRNSASYWPPRRPLTTVLLRTKIAR